MSNSLAIDKIPPELKARPQWVVWRQEEREGKPTKVPYRPQNPKKKANTTAPDTWGTFEQALGVAQTNSFHGIGYVFSPQDDYAGVDLDKCRDRETGEIEPWAMANIDRLQSYTEKSPSGTGLHILIKGKVPAGGNKKGKVEMYSQGRYFTMTGHHLEGTPTTIEARQSEVEALHKEVFGANDKPVAATTRPTPTLGELTDFALIDKAKLARNGDKFARLWGGDTTGYDTPSEATAALLCLLAYWTNKHHGRVDRLFRQSGLMRDKWDKPQSGSTWGALEIGKAIDRTYEVYTPGKDQDRPKGEPGEQAAQEDKPKPTQAQLLIKLAGDAELFHDMNRKGYATIPVDGHMETWPIKSTAFRDWLGGRFYKAHGKTPNGQALQETLDLLAAQARYDGPEHEVLVRIAHTGDKVFVDLANKSWQAVEITPQSWRVVDNPPVKFRRPRGLAPMPCPESGGNLVDLRPFINCREEDWPLVVAWIIGAYSPGPYPIMIFQGEQGTAKSTTARALKNMVDPGHSPQRTAPRDVRDLMISASNSWSLSFDNLSNLPPWLSDGFCRLATGGGLSTRELYSDDSETILDAMRPVIINGIDSLVSRADLADRAILLELPQIDNGRRRPEKDLWKAFEAAQPGTLGAMFKAVSAALANVHGLRLPEYPRMADFAKWVVAAEPALPWEPGTFLDVYSKNRAAVVEHSLESDVVAVGVRLLMADREAWEGAPSALLEALETITPESTIRSKAWPKAANVLSNRLRRAATFLRAVGIEFESGYVQRTRRFFIRKGMQKTVATVATVASDEYQGVTCNDACNDATMLEKRPLQLKVNNHAGYNDSNDSNDKIHTFSKADDKGLPVEEVEF